MKTGGIAESLFSALLKDGRDIQSISLCAFDDRFYPQGSRLQVLEQTRLSPKDLVSAVKNLLSLTGKMQYTHQKEKN